MKCDQLIFRKIIQIVVTRCHILRLKCTKFDFGGGSAQYPTGGTYSAPPDLLVRFKGGLLLSEGENREQGKRGLRGRGE